MKRFSSESELAKTCAAWMAEQGWELWFEVQFHGVADIVGVNGPLTWIVETKQSCSLDVFEQAMCRLPHAHIVSIAVPTKIRNPEVVRTICKATGIGVISVSREFTKEFIKPQYRRRICRYGVQKQGGIRGALHDAQKASVPGSCGGYWSPFKQTCAALKEYVVANPGCTLKQAIEMIPTHYSSPSTARSSLAKWIRFGKIPGLSVKVDGRRLKLYAT